MKSTKPFLSTVDMVLIALFAVLIAICAWISIPATVPFTLQTFAVLCALGLLGGKRGTFTIIVYLLMGAIGLPVFSNFGGGLGKLLGVTGGYLVGFLASALVYWLFTRLFGQAYWVRLTGMLLGLAVCYAFGTAWFMVAYVPASGPVSLPAALAMCVIPFLIPEAVKFALAAFIVKVVPARVKALR